MTQHDLNLYREMLTDRREEIKNLQDISEQSRSAVELDQASVGRVSRVDALQAQQMALAVERQRTEEVAWSCGRCHDQGALEHGR